MAQAVEAAYSGRGDAWRLRAEARQPGDTPAQRIAINRASLFGCAWWRSTEPMRPPADDRKSLVSSLKSLGEVLSTSNTPHAAPHQHRHIGPRGRNDRNYRQRVCH